MDVKLLEDKIRKKIRRINIFIRRENTIIKTRVETNIVNIKVKSYGCPVRSRKKETTFSFKSPPFSSMSGVEY